MEKEMFKGGTMLNPLPVVMVSCGNKEENYNIITIAWTGIVNSEPPMTYVSVRKSRHSHKIIKDTNEFVINLTTEALAYATDFCGVKSGRTVNKFQEMNLKAVKGEKVDAPLIDEAPVNLECKVKQIIEMPSHDMFLAEIVNVHVAKNLIDENHRIMLEKAGLVCYNHGEYFGIKRKSIGKFGYSVMKPKTRKRINREKNRNTMGYKGKHRKTKEKSGNSLSNRKPSIKKINS